MKFFIRKSKTDINISSQEPRRCHEQHNPQRIDFTLKLNCFQTGISVNGLINRPHV